jgi:hypothetical protein
MDAKDVTCGIQYISHKKKIVDQIKEKFRINLNVCYFQCKHIKWKFSLIKFGLSLFHKAFKLSLFDFF